MLVIRFTRFHLSPMQRAKADRLWTYSLKKKNQMAHIFALSYQDHSAHKTKREITKKVGIRERVPSLSYSVEGDNVIKKRRKR